MSTEPGSRSPRPQEVLRAALDYALSDVHTALPGRVESYDAASQKADIKPLIQRRVVTRTGDELLEPLPVLPQVPVVFPRSSSFHLTFPLAEGDLVLLVFVERSIDNYVAGSGDDTDPDEFRMHDLSDAVALPGFYPNIRAIGDIDTARMSLGADDGGMKIAISESAVEVTFDNGQTLKLEGKEDNSTMTLGDGGAHAAIGEALETLWGQLNTYLDTHVHPTGVGPSGPPSTPSTTYDSSVTSTKLALPSG